MILFVLERVLNLVWCKVNKGHVIEYIYKLEEI